VLATTLFTASGAHAYDIESLERDRFYTSERALDHKAHDERALANKVGFKQDALK
jgi:hypothetical protein